MSPAVPLQTTWGSGTKDTKFSASTPKTKEKTRRATVADIEQSTQEATLQVEDMEPQQPTIEVCQESIDLFHRMFTSYASSKNTAACRWEDFTSALRDAGCLARQNGGSAVAFTHPMVPDDVIVIHRPHPDPTINPIMLRRVGKKFEKRFGWDESTFVLRDKKAQLGKT